MAVSTSGLTCNINRLPRGQVHHVFLVFFGNISDSPIWALVITPAGRQIRSVQKVLYRSVITPLSCEFLCPAS